MGSEFGRIRALKSASGDSLSEVPPGIPVEVSGLRGMPHAGDDFLVQPKYGLPVALNDLVSVTFCRNPSRAVMAFPPPQLCLNSMIY